MAPVLVRTRSELDAALAEHRAGPAGTTRIGFVPTMGALHQGHLALVRRARSVAPVVVASVFVNPTQFGPGEDFDAYPRPWSDDLALLAGEGVDVVFRPDAGEVYPAGDSDVTVDPGELGTVLEGAIRPTHFRGVLTVVAKLFGLVRPDVAVFGEKDYQQLVLVQQMTRTLRLPVEVLGEPTVREPDGLALSSRNGYLDDAARATAPGLWRALATGVEQARAGAGADEVLKAARTSLEAVDGLAPDYVAVTDPHLGPPPDSGPGRLLVAARVGGVRLIDNAELMLGAGT